MGHTKIIPKIIKEYILSRTPVRSEFVPKEKDVMLVSYPKSGNTWVRALLANYIFPGISLADMERKLPDIYVSTKVDLLRSHYFSFGGRVIKSHEAYRPFYGKVIYIFRDPRDVMISYFFYWKKINRLNKQYISINDFMIDYVNGNLNRYGSWYQNFESWLELKKDNILYLSYEELLQDTKYHLIKIIDFLGEKKENKLIDMALKHSSIDSLRKKEMDESNKWKETKNKTDGTKFFRIGKSGQWKEYDQEIFKKITQNWGNLMNRMGYQVSN